MQTMADQTKTDHHGKFFDPFDEKWNDGRVLDTLRGSEIHW